MTGSVTRFFGGSGTAAGARTELSGTNTSTAGALAPRNAPRGPSSAGGERAADAVDADRLGLDRADGPERRVARGAVVDARPAALSGSGAVRSTHAIEEFTIPPLPEGAAAPNIRSAIIACTIRELTIDRPKRSSGRRRRPPLRLAGRYARRRRPLRHECIAQSAPVYCTSLSLAVAVMGPAVVEGGAGEY